MKAYFDQLEPMKPVSTGEKFKNNLSDEELKRIKAVIFDVYGTILISSSGDVFEFKHGKENVLRAFEKAEVECNGQIMDLEFGETVIQEYLDTINKFHEEKKSRGITCPEIRIEEVWETVMNTLVEKELVKNRGNLEVKTLATIFEFLSNPTYPMPGLQQMLEDLSREGHRLGIVSNAQFYTPILLRYFLGVNDFLKEQPIPYFEEKFVKLSYREGYAKPGLELFTGICQTLSEENIAPYQVLFVGNDMLKDIYPASKVGFKTVLFAGDKRSLRHRKYALEVRDLEPDVVTTHLDQIKDLLRFPQ
jgi:putative hydrolase of the HAD superfamily